MHDPRKIPTNVLVWEHIPEFRRKTELCSVIDTQWVDEGQKPSPAEIDKMVRLAIWMCSDKSPYYEETDYKVRVAACISEVKIDKRSPMGRMISDFHWWYLRVLISYMMLYASRQFTQWFTSKVALYHLFEVLMQPNIGTQDGDVKSAVKSKTDAIKTINDLADDVTQMEARLFPMTELAEQVFRQQLFDMENTAEQYAEKWEDEFV